jgi:hypothetical protein
MSDELIVYVKNDTQKNELKKKYPDAKAEYLNLTPDGAKGMGDILPMVCMVKDGKERCESGEEYIDIFSKEMK